MKRGGFVGEKETALKPYSNIFFGAYFSRSDLIIKIENLIYSSKQRTIQGKNIKYLCDLTPYFKEYAKGFQKNRFLLQCLQKNRTT